MYSDFRGYLLGFCFSESIFWGFLSVAKYFLGSSEIPNSVDPCVGLLSPLPGFKLLLLAPNLLTASRWRSPKVFCLFPYNTNKMTGPLAVFQGRSRSLR